MKLADTHCHLDFSAFDQCRKEVLLECCRQSVEMIIVPTVKKALWSKALALSVEHASIGVALGMHPYFIKDHMASDFLSLEKMLESESAIVGIGEIGLDATVDAFPKQERYFTEQLILAEKYQLPVILHARKAHAQVVRYLKEYSLIGGVVHAFSGSLEQLKEYTKLGVHIGVGGVITFQGSTKTRNAIAKAPLEFLLLETDAPDMPVFGNDTYKGDVALSHSRTKKSSPYDVRHVFESLCDIRDESPDEIAEQLWLNSCGLFYPALISKKVNKG